MYSIITKDAIKNLIHVNIKAWGWDEPMKWHILSFWTTFCCVNNIYPDTYSYDAILCEIYKDIITILPSKIRAENAEIETFETFDNFMCQHLV